MNSIQNYGMTNYSVGFKARIPDNSRALKEAKKDINRYRTQIQAYKDYLKENPEVENVNPLINKFAELLHKVIIKAKLLKKGYNPDELLLSMTRRKELLEQGFSSLEISRMQEFKQLTILAKSGDRAAFRELVKKSAEELLASARRKFEAGNITAAEYTELKQKAMEDAKKEVMCFLS